ncbi:hypothetical protein NMG60_11018194 [Bertholletia excelsa]
MARVCARAEAFQFRFCILVVSFFTIISVSGRSDQDIRERFYGNLSLNSSPPNSSDGSIAQMFDRVLEKEFSDNDQPEDADKSSFNSSVADQEAVLETVAKIPMRRERRMKLMRQIYSIFGTRSFQFNDVFSLETEDSDDTTTLIDKKDNVFVMSNKQKSKYPVLQLDLRLISDLVVVIVSAAIGGIIFSCLGQPVIVGYLLAGSIIGPGGLKFSEMVQVETVAQFGVVFLLFALGLEFSLAKFAFLKAVGPVAVIGGLLQIAILLFFFGIIAVLCGAKLSEGIFVGCFLSMSSTAVVVKFLVDRNSSNTLHGQVTIGTLIFQDCAVGLLFALLPVLGGNSGILQGMVSMGRLLLVLSLYLFIASILTWSFVPRFLKLMIKLSSQTNELYQLASVAFCLLSAWCSDKLGLSLELGSFLAGVMISTTEFAQHTLDQVEPIRNLFAALFLSSIGMLIHVHFLWTHVDILLASVILVVAVKTTIAAMVTKAFGYSSKTSFLVGVMLAQIGEFAFVLLSRASSLHLVEGKVYLLLLGTTALSLVMTPVLFKLIPAMMHFGVLLHWFPSESSTQNEVPFSPYVGERMEKAGKVRCQRISCNAMFSEDDNPEGCCTYHDSVGLSAPPKKIVDINEPQVCRNKGCGKTFKEKDNHDTACSYHPGPAVFHDRMRGWKCCDMHVKEFDEFMNIPPCTKGWHNADPVS